MVELVQYETEDGACPFAEWFDGLDVRAALKVRTALARMELGNFGDVKPVGQGVSERRIDFGPGLHFYFAQEGRKLVVLLGRWHQEASAALRSPTRIGNDDRSVLVIVAECRRLPVNACESRFSVPVLMWR